jgi:hypothetical protein
VTTYPADLACECNDPATKSCKACRAYEESKRADRLSHRIENSGMPTALRRHSLLGAEPGPSLDAAHRWIDGEMVGLCLHGGVGVGKTWLAAAAAWARLQHHPLQWVSVARMMSQLRSGFGSDQKAQADKIVTGTGSIVLGNRREGRGGLLDPGHDQQGDLADRVDVRRSGGLSAGRLLRDDPHGWRRPEAVVTAFTDQGREVRERRAELKRELKAGDAKLSQILRDEIPAWLETLSAERLLRGTPHVGPHAASSLLQEAELGPRQPAKHITTRQRLLLAVELEKIENLKSKSGKRARTKFERGVR